MNENEFDELFKDKDFSQFFNARLEQEIQPIKKNRDEILEEKRILQDDFKTLRDENMFFKEQGEKERERQRADYRRNTLDSAYAKHGFKKELLPLLESYLEKEGLTMDDERNLSVGTGEDSRPLSDWLTEFSNTDQGKMMIPAGYNTGIGAHGSGPGWSSSSSSDPKRMSRDQLINALDK